MSVMPCPHCSNQMQLPDDAAGKQFRCGSCKQVFTAGAAPARVAAGVGAAAGGGAAVATRPSAPPAKPAAKPPTPSGPTSCPACGTQVPEGAVSCMDCGYLLQAEASGEAEGAPVICPNPACGVANPPGERNCVRCTAVLPTAPGTMLHNRYKVEKLLAMGGFGAVYLATDTKGGNRQVAIKDMICADQQEFAIRLNFFRREAEVLKSLEAIPIVPRLIDLVEQGQTAHLIMEFIRGRDLLKTMEDSNNQPFTIDQIVPWSVAICDVLTHMHTQQPPLVHRDLKPDNVMLLEDGKTIKMIDFGTARDLGRTAHERSKVKTKVYTEGYAPLEQMGGKPEPRSDLFALAGTMYHLATGIPPSGTMTAHDLETKLADGSIPADQRWFFDLIRINLAEDPNDRYFTAREIRNDLQQRRVTREVNCAKCSQSNKVREPYCGKCANPLTDETPPCANCGKNNRMGSRYCIHCGYRVGR